MLLARTRAASFGAPQASSGLRWSASAGVVAMSVILSAFLLWAEVLPSVWLRAAEDARLEGGAYGALYERAANGPWPNAEAHRRYGIALAETGREPEAYLEFERALTGVDTGDVYLALAMLASNAGDRDLTRHWARQCLERWPWNDDARRLTEQTRGKL
jgi:tetratricopeptide (TPR) repeat protein